MKREIKFRAWNPASKEMGKPFDLSTMIRLSEKIGNAGINTKKRFDDYILMQFTGLTDTNEVEIYEGDIIKVDGNPIGVDDEFIEIKFSEGGFVVEADFDEYDMTTIGWAINIWDIESRKVEVIGNIYENPELIK